MNQFNQKATCFIVINKIDKLSTWNDNSIKMNSTKLMNSSQIREWIDYGYEIGSHTLDCEDLTKLTYENKKSNNKIFFKIKRKFWN